MFLLQLARQKKQLTITPKLIYSVAEVLEPSDETEISDAFNCPISQVYQCTEGFLAISDKRSNHLVMNEEFLIIEKEWLDEHRFVPIITDLFRSTQPIIRYRLDDVLIVKNTNNVFTELTTIEGRVGDVCYGKQEHKKVPIFADTIRQHMVSSPVAFEDYLICQQAINEFSIQVVPELMDKNLLIDHLNQLFSQKNCELPNWHWQIYENKTMDVKRRRIQSFLSLT